jgi:membrane fusion protein
MLFLLVISIFIFPIMDTLRLQGAVKDNTVMVSVKNSGVIDEVFIQEGNKVSINDNIIKIDMGESSLFDKDTYLKQLAIFEERMTFIENKLDILVKNKISHENLFLITKKKYKEKITMLRKNIITYKKIYEEQINIVDSIKNNKIKNILSRKDVADLEIEIANTNFKILDIESAIETNESEVDIAEKMYEIDVMQIDQQIAQENANLAALKQQLIELQSSHAETVSAIVNGRISRIYIKKGDFVEKGSVIAAITPETSTYEIYLRSNSQKIGKVKVGQKAKIWYEAFPKAEFGSYNGIISYVGKEPDYTLASTSPYKANIDTYLIKIKIEDPYVYRNQEKFSLINGSAVEVSIQLDKKKIISWLLGSLLEAK